MTNKVQIDQDFLRNLAHELRNPVNAIAMSSEFGAMLAERGEVDGEKLHDLFKDIRKQCNDLAAVVNTLDTQG